MGVSKFEVGLGKAGKYQWKLVGPSGSDILFGEGFQHKEGCMEAIREVKANASFLERYYRNKANSGKLSFRIKSASHVVVAKSVDFEKEEALEQAIVLVRKSSQAAVIER